jgi:hypothetical protein
VEISDFKEKLKKLCPVLRFPGPEVVSEGLVSIKVRVNAQENTSIEIYFNEETQTMTSALIVEGERVFGINGYPKSKTWHMHPFGRVKEHVKIEPMRLEEDKV